MINLLLKLKLETKLLQSCNLLQNIRSKLENASVISNKLKSTNSHETENIRKNLPIFVITIFQLGILCNCDLILSNLNFRTLHSRR
jgi:hypothetical protein